LYTQSTGNGPAIILLHGFSFDADSWDAQFDKLAAEYFVVRYDLRGFGRSDKPTGTYDHIEDLRAVLDAFDVVSADLIGLSLGANVALGLSLTHPDRVRKLILVSPGLQGYRWKGERPPDAALARAKEHGIEAARDFWLHHELFASARNHPLAGPLLTKSIAKYSGWHWSNHNPAKPNPATAERLAEVSSPTLVINGRHDLEDYRAIGTLIADDIPGAKRVEILDGGHMAPIEAPAIFNEKVLTFLRAPER
jgi:pimeloyl-ACP methyl ester carboxylesterase